MIIGKPLRSIADVARHKGVRDQNAVYSINSTDPQQKGHVRQGHSFG